MSFAFVCGTFDRGQRSFRAGNQGHSMAVSSRQPRRSIAIVVLVFSTACHSLSPQHHRAPNYLVTETSIDVGVGVGLCVAINPNDEHSVWWWEAGGSGCASRSTGPGIFRGDRARVSRSSDGSIATEFRLGTHSTSRPFIDVRLVIERGLMRSIDTGAQVAIQARSDLDIPEKPPAGRRIGQ